MESLKGKPVYFTLDLDVLDPSVFPGTGTPEPGGIDYMTLQRAVIAVCQNVCLVGCDVNELCPPYDARWGCPRLWHVKLSEKCCWQSADRRKEEIIMGKSVGNRMWRCRKCSDSEMCDEQ